MPKTVVIEAIDWIQLLAYGPSMPMRNATDWTVTVYREYGTKLEAQKTPPGGDRKFNGNN